jgi:hypothetical protein
MSLATSVSDPTPGDGLRLAVKHGVDAYRDMRPHGQSEFLVCIRFLTGTIRRVGIGRARSPARKSSAAYMSARVGVPCRYFPLTKWILEPSLKAVCTATLRE